MKILWLVSERVREYTRTARPEESLLQCPVASARLRTGIAAAEFARRGHQNFYVEPERESALPALDGSAGVCIVTKFYSDSTLEKWMAAVHAARSAGYRSIIDLSDHPFMKSAEVAAFYQQALREADAVVGNSQAMVDMVAQSVRGRVAVIGDPVLAPPRKPDFSPGKQLELLWFGHASNARYLLPLLEPITRFSQNRACRLTVVSEPEGPIHEVARAVHDLAPYGLKAEFTPWSLSATGQALRKCDLVLLPSDPASPKKAGASANRLAEAINAGRFAVASPLRSYQTYEDCAWVGEDLMAGVSWTLANRGDVLARLRRGQRKVAEELSAPAIAAQWGTLLDAVANATEAAGMSTSAPSDASTALKRLNLGCGDKILPGYVNVDVVESRAGKRPDVICDLHNLDAFEDASVDEILSVHVVEHFWRWEVVDILREWVRVLKPGGKMVLECPNLISAAQQLLDNPDVAAGPGPEGQRSMWVFYGDPSWRDPLMIHRWGYTPRSLAQIMHEAGLVNLRQEPAQFKLREPRDMRIVGDKPL
jgi:SAM-dependent methyltransferase